MKRELYQCLGVYYALGSSEDIPNIECNTLMGVSKCSCPHSLPHKKRNRSPEDGYGACYRKPNKYANIGCECREISYED